MTASPTPDFWSAYQPGFRFTTADRGTPEFFRAVERHRYALEPHIREIVQFERWAGKGVLEAGCGIGTDGTSFARAGARYVGLDSSAAAIDLARTRFEQEGIGGEFVLGSVTELPFDDDSFDLVYSHGVVHHVPETERAIAEFHRVLRPGGTALVMLYHRNSVNYLVTIMLVRRALAATLFVPGALPAIARVTRERRAVLEAHRELLRKHGLRYLTDTRLFLSNNTDGPGNPLSKVYSRREAAALFSPFASVETDVRFLNLRIYPSGEALAGTRPARWLERRVGWHLYVRARKG
jgi:ubiquinone/menaquinone biosynthesis C-methylase UbiE